MQVGVGYSDSPDSAAAGKQAVQEALSKVKKEQPCDLVLLFSTARHNQQILREGVAELVGDSCRIFGGGAAGIITNDRFGYAGDQVGAACIWLEDSQCNVVAEEGLLESELDTGERMGKRLAELGVSQDSSVMLFYDAVDQTEDKLRLLMATWVLEGLEKGLGFFPDITGAGMQGDHTCTPVQQYLGDKMGQHSAFALAFSDNVRIDSVIMHGCRPSSPYYTVTKAEGPVILEINGEPALSFMDKLLGSALTPEDYPFFLLFGINYGERWGEYNEKDYASRLCFGIDKERDGIIMFEPDMVAGTQFQIMFRSLDLDYMKPKIQEVFDKVEGREPLFAMYIDCAGRCAGYGGVDLEDAYVIQEAVKDRIPLLGLYTGVEIASTGGRPRGLDWTGVFCIFSRSKSDKEEENKKEDISVWNKRNEENRGEEATLDEMAKLCEQNTAKILSLDTKSIAIRHELEQKRRGFSLLAELAVSLQQRSGNENIFSMATRRINGALNMQKTVALFPDEDGRYSPFVLQGYSMEEKAELVGKHIHVDAKLLDMEKPVLLTAANDERELADLRKALHLPYFISVPVIVENKVAAILITGRMVEAPPFLSRLGHNDIETLRAVSALLATTLVYQRLDSANKKAQSDVLTGLLNRGALELQTTELLNQEQSDRKTSAFIMIDFDYFKQVNDNYGHMMGDVALKELAQTLDNNFGKTDVVARLGGDEFAVFCALRDNVEQIIHKVARLIETWSRTPIISEDGNSFYTTLSIGVALAPENGSSYNELLHKADMALYKSKQRGRNRYTIYNEEIMQN